MNNNRFEFKFSLLLVEIIITVFFFALSGIGCIRLYLKAHNLADEARQSTGAVIAAQNLAEAFICAEGDMTQAAQLLVEMGAAAAAETDGNTERLSIPYDSDWALMKSDSDGAFNAVLTISVNNSGADADQPLLHRASIEVTDLAGNVLYEIPELCVLEGGETP